MKGIENAGINHDTSVKNAYEITKNNAVAINPQTPMIACDLYLKVIIPF